MSILQTRPKNSLIQYLPTYDDQINIVLTNLGDNKLIYKLTQDNKLTRIFLLNDDDFNLDQHYNINEEFLLFSRQGDHVHRSPERTEEDHNIIIAESNNMEVSTLNKGISSFSDF